MIKFSLHPLGDSALLIRFGNVIDPKINADVHAATTYLQSARLPGVYDFVAGYTSLTLHYDSLAWLELEQLLIEALTACIVHLLTNFSVAPITTKEKTHIQDRSSKKKPLSESDLREFKLIGDTIK